MTTQTERRLEALETVAAAQPLLGYRNFTQSDSDPELYFEGVRTGLGSRAYTKAEIDDLGAAGWQCILIVYKSADPAAIRLTWGDDLAD